MQRCGAGFGGLALQSLLARDNLLADVAATTNPLAPRMPHFAPQAKAVIFLFMYGGPSHVDLFDPKPALAQWNGKGRDHHPKGFTMWMAGGGIKGGTVYGATDEFGYEAIENRVSVPDLHATILHQLGLDHKQLTYQHTGRDYRLTDVSGKVVRDILA